MPEWYEDFSRRTLEEIVRSQDENRAWHKDLRMRALKLVNDRLAKQVGLDEYATNRRIGQADAAECKRRGSILLHEFSIRRMPR
jgi:hypothetical protein